MKSTPKFNSPQERASYAEGMARVKLRRELAAAAAKQKALKKKGQLAEFHAAAATGGVRHLSRGKRKQYRFFSTLGGSRAALEVVKAS
jgi:hypothetical protein